MQEDVDEWWRPKQQKIQIICQKASNLHKRRVGSFGQAIQKYSGKEHRTIFSLATHRKILRNGHSGHEEI